MSSTWGETAALDNQEGCLLVTAQSAVLAISVVVFRVLRVGNDASTAGYSELIDVLVTLHDHGEGIAGVIRRQA